MRHRRNSLHQQNKLDTGSFKSVSQYYTQHHELKGDNAFPMSLRLSFQIKYHTKNSCASPHANPALLKLFNGMRFLEVSRLPMQNEGCVAGMRQRSSAQKVRRKETTIAIAERNAVFLLNQINACLQQRLP